ncbi:unnamed protein product [Prunus armeniaca]
MLSRWLCVYPVTLAGSSHLQIPLSSTVMGLFAGDEPCGLEVLGTELAAIREGLRVMSAAGFSRFTVASDSQQAMTILQERGEW